MFAVRLKFQFCNCLVNGCFREQLRKRREVYSVDHKNSTTGTSKRFLDDHTFVCNLSNNHRKLVGIVRELSKSNALQVFFKDYNFHHDIFNNRNSPS